jgi:hypothetical protein
VVLTALALAGLAALPLAVPGTADLPVVRALPSLVGDDAGSVALVAAVVLGVLTAVLALLRDGDADDAPFDTLRERPPAAVTAGSQARAGGGFDGRLARAAERGGGSMDDVRTRLREVAAESHAAATGLDAETARAHIETGEWTDDRTARAFLASGRDVTPSVTSRVRLWLDPPTERRRRVRVTVDEIATLLEGER